MSSILIGWVAFYDDGKRYSSKETKWKDLPLNGLLVVVEFYSDGSKKKYFNKDYYVFDDKKVFGTNDIHPYLAKLGTIKYGRWCEDSVFNQTIIKADEEKWPFYFQQSGQ